MGRSTLFALAGGIALSVAAWGQVDPKALVARSIQNYERDWNAARADWTYTQTDTTRADGGKQVDVAEVVPLWGTPYERLIRKDGKPLTPAEQRKEDRKFERTMRQREKETPAEREARIRKYENDRAFLKDVPNAYDFRVLGEDSIDGRPAWVIGLQPRSGFVPTTMRASMLAHIHGKLWIDKEEVQWARAEAHVTDIISIGWILARIAQGAEFTVEQTRVENDLWLPRRITINGMAHVLLLHSKAINEELTFSGYRKDEGISADKKATVPAPAGSFR